MNRELIPYRDNVDGLIAEVTRLQKENTKLHQQISLELIYPWSEASAECRLCGKFKEIVAWDDEFGNAMTKPRKERVPCLTQEWENPYNPSWFKRLFGCKPRPGRMKRTCEFCHGTYYELPKEPCNDL